MIPFSNRQRSSIIKLFVDQFISLGSMKRLLDLQLKELKAQIIKSKDPNFNITHIKKTWIEGHYKKAHKRISIKK